MLGDFNLPEVDWSTNVCADDGVHNTIHELINNHGFIQFVKEPTRYNHNQNSINDLLTNNNVSGNILDIILSNDPLSVDVDNILPPLCTPSAAHTLVDQSTLGKSKSPNFGKFNMAPLLDARRSIFRAFIFVLICCLKRCLLVLMLMDIHCNHAGIGYYYANLISCLIVELFPDLISLPSSVLFSNRL